LEGNRRWVVRTVVAVCTVVVVHTVVVVRTVVGSSTWSLGHPHCRWVVRTVVGSSAPLLGCLHHHWVPSLGCPHRHGVGPRLIVASDVGTWFEMSLLVLKRWCWGRDIAIGFETLSLGSRIFCQFRDVDARHSLVNGSSKEKEVDVDTPCEPPMSPLVQLCP